ncbi:MAG: response regulator [Sulfurimonas sp.]|jgi:PAS domain S-box-containing protein
MKINAINKLLPYSKKLNLLYVEDDTSTRKIFHKIFEELFSVVYVAKDADEGLNLFSTNYIDIVITDIEMPKMSGLEMARIIRKQRHDVPIIVMTAHIENKFFIESIEIGIDAYLLKPIEQKMLLNTLSRIVYNIKAVKSLHDDSHYFRVLTEASIVSKSDTKGIITYVNDNLCKISGYTREELIGRSHNIFKHPNTPTTIYKEIWNTILRGEVWSGRMENLNKNGNSFLADTIIIPLEDNKGIISEFIAIRQDVTEYVNLKRKMNAEMLKKEEEQRINEAKEAFLILFTHELKTPLNAIINFSKYIHTKLINSQYLEPLKTAKLLKSIISNAYDMLDNVNNILDISKLQANKLSYAKRLFSLNKLIISLLEQFDSLINAKHIEIELLIDEEFEIHSDEYRVKQILSNILSNAIKYGNNKISIEIKKSNGTIEIYIEDNGKGIANKESVFNLYEQGNTSLIKRETQGTGIGLYFVKLVCNDLNIKYTLEDSKRLGGTRFGLLFEMNNKNKEVDR